MSRRSVAHDACGLILWALLLLVGLHPVEAFAARNGRRGEDLIGRDRVNLNTGWRFLRSTTNPDKLAYDQRPDNANQSDVQLLKPWILPSANDFISDPTKHYLRPAGNLAGNVSFVQKTFDDSAWEAVNLPHDWAIQGPFTTAGGGGMGRLPSAGISWYRRRVSITAADEEKSIYLDIDGAMSYAMVWLNGNLVGGWPYGYNSFRLDLTPYVKTGDDNLLAIRLDNPPDSARWYPGGGLYRNIWLTKASPTHVAQWGTFISSRSVSAQSAILDLAVQVENSGRTSQQVEVVTAVHLLDSTTGQIRDVVSKFARTTLAIQPGHKHSSNNSVTIQSPRLWMPSQPQGSHLYVAITQLSTNNKTIDTYETRFGIRSVVYDPNDGLLINGQKVRIQGVNMHHDLGALGAAFNTRAAERRLELLRDLGCNAIRMSHNPPAPELLDLTDRMGFLVLDEVFDSWESQKTTNDFHLIFSDWHEADLRAFIRRDRHHPSVVVWSVGNEVGEQTSGDAGAAIARELHDIAHEEDPTRPSTASMNAARPGTPFPQALDLVSLNYQGEGIRDTPAYAGLAGNKTPPLYPDFHAAYPNKMIFSSETAAALSTRGTYLFPVTNETSAPVTSNQTGSGNATSRQVSAYDLYTADFGSSPDKVFASQDKNPYVAGEFVWSGWDYLGEPTPYDASRSSYYGIVDLAGFKKDRYYLYQARWRSDLQTAHILPHWTWPDRVGQVTPVHVFTAADEAELFLNGQSLGRQTRKTLSDYRFRWDTVAYQPGELHVATFKDGKVWANDTVRTTGAATHLRLTADRAAIKADGLDLSFVTVEVLDDREDVVPQADNLVTFSLSGPGEIVATDNGDPTDMVSFPSKKRRVYSGLALAIIRANTAGPGPITVTATGVGVAAAEATLAVQ